MNRTGEKLFGVIAIIAGIAIVAAAVAGIGAAAWITFVTSIAVIDLWLLRWLVAAKRWSEVDR